MATASTGGRSGC
ncbi:hypothetical protein LINPERHAP1_LOCUS36488 [Linum perenne]